MGFLTRYDRELREPLVWCQGSQVSIRVARGPLPVGRSVVPSGRPSCLSEVSPPPPRPAGCGPFKGAPVWGRPALEEDSGGAPARRATRHGHGVPGHRAAPVPAALGARTAALSAEPERPRAAAAAAQLFATPWTVAARFFSPWDSPGKNTVVGSHSLLQGIFQTQGLNPGLLHCRQILYHLIHLGSPIVYGVGKSWT